MKLSQLVCTAILFLSGCFGRVIDQKSSQSVDLSEFGLEKNVPTLLSFGALWCKPCRAEITALNSVYDQYSPQLQVKGIIVEGESYGQIPTFELVSQDFLGIDHERPKYALGLDPNWNLFDRLSPNNGHQLPTIVFIDAKGKVVRVVQRSLEFESELKPMIEMLLANQLQENPPPSKDPNEPEQQIKSLLLVEWTKNQGNTPDTVKFKNMTSAWRKGRGNYGFSADDMPFLDGKLNFKETVDGDVPISAEWSHDSEAGRCYLKVVFKPDGSFLSASGICT